MPSRPDSSESAFPEPFSPREARPADAVGPAGDFPPPFRVDRVERVERAPEDGAEPPAQDELEEALPWLVTRDEAGTSATAEPDAAAWPGEPSVDEGTAGTALPDWLDIDLGDDEPAAEEPAVDDAGWSVEETAPETPAWEAEGERTWEEDMSEPFADADASDPAPVQEGPRLVPADDIPDPTPPAGTSMLAGGVLGEQAEEVRDVRDVREAAPEEMSGSIGEELDSGAREAAARRLEEIADWLREADLGEELAAADERGVRLFLAGVVLGRRESPGG
jgi:hypothetical protein